MVTTGGTVTVGGTILAGNTGGDYAGATVTDNGYNLVGTVSGGATFTGTGTQTGVTNPQLGPLADNGGPTQTRPPAPASPAINAGAATCNVAYTDAVTGMPVTLTTDQRGVSRPQGSACDIGAVEARYTARGVNNTGDGAADATRCYDPAATTCRLRDAIAASRCGRHDHLRHAACSPRPADDHARPRAGATDAGGERDDHRAGGGRCSPWRGAPRAGTPQFRIFQVNSGVTATISGLTITGGDVHSAGTTAAASSATAPSRSPTRR